jgi:hypothetical protein
MILKIYKDKSPILANVEEIQHGSNHPAGYTTGYFQYEFLCHNGKYAGTLFPKYSLTCGPIDVGDKSFAICLVPDNWKDTDIKEIIIEIMSATYYNDSKKLIEKRMKRTCEKYKCAFTKCTNCL